MKTAATGQNSLTVFRVFLAEIKRIGVQILIQSSVHVRYSVLEMSPVVRPPSELAKALGQLSLALDRARDLKTELDVFESEVRNFQFLRIQTGEVPEKTLLYPTEPADHPAL